MGARGMRLLEEFGVKTSKYRMAIKLRSYRYQCSGCGVIVGRHSSVCHHCGADLR